MAVYKRLEIAPRVAVLLPTVLLAPLPLAAADDCRRLVGRHPRGRGWAGSLALAAWDRHRTPALAASAALLLASIVALYR
ncbi:hypothetical protein ACFYNW_29740 [Streptomyces virginiae]|uniref:hypothetical protein n=1 Tax=Streptomyces virginiae TaxID=1961 RepID=UPI0036E48CA1